MDESRLQVECPHCGAVFNVPDGPAGRQETCPVCRGAVRVLDVQQAPAPSAEVAPLPAEATDEAAAGASSAEPMPQDYFALAPAGPLVTEDSGYCLVCCAAEEKLAPGLVGPLLCAFDGLARRDAAAQVTHGMGILAERLAPDTALNMVEALKGKGIEAFAVPAEKAPQPVDSVHYINIWDADARALHVQMDPQGTIRALGWDAVVAGVCTKERFAQRREVEYDTEFNIMGGGPMGAPVAVPSFKRRVKVVEPPLTLSLALRDNHGRLHLMAVTPSKVRYTYLGERLTTSHDLNFGLFLTDVAGWVPGAFFPPSYHAVAGGHAARVVRPFSKVTYQNYVRWAVCCAVARGRLPDRKED
jgi:hypothetical protein